MSARILVGDARERLSELSESRAQTCVTSPPYWALRDYGHEGQLGMEATAEEYVLGIVDVFREVRRVLTDTGTLWLNLGDSFGPNKQLAGIPWRVAFALQADGWYLRQDIIWAKPNVMPESVKDRCTKSHEYLFLLTKQPRYYFDWEAIREPVAEVSLRRAELGWKSDRPSTKTSEGGIDVEVMGERFVNPDGRNKRDVWTIPPASFRGAHFAVMPEALVEPCVLAGSAPGDLVLDPFTGSGTVAVVALRHGRNFVGVELNADYAALAEGRIYDDAPLFNQVGGA